MQNKIQLDFFNGNELIKSKNININKWYDGDIIEIDSDDYRKQNMITMIKGTQYDQHGAVEECWFTYYDNLGRLIKSERYDSNLKLIDTEEIRYDLRGKIIK